MTFDQTTTNVLCFAKQISSNNKQIEKDNHYKYLDNVLLPFCKCNQYIFSVNLYLCDFCIEELFNTINLETHSSLPESQVNTWCRACHKTAYRTTNMDPLSPLLETNLSGLPTVTLYKTKENTIDGKKILCYIIHKYVQNTQTVNWTAIGARRWVNITLFTYPLNSRNSISREQCVTSPY